MTFERVFLGWHRPCLHLTADYLIQKYKASELDSNLIDLSSAMIVLPGARAQRRLLEILVDRADQLEKRLAPPRFITAGALPEVLLSNKQPLATDLVRRLIWVDVLQSEAKSVAGAIGFLVPRAADLTSWLGLAKHFDGLYVELSANGLSFSDVAKTVENVYGEAEAVRWHGLNALWARCLERLKTLGLADKYDIRMMALDSKIAATEFDVYLIAASDLPLVTRKLLANLDQPIYPLIFAPEDCSHLFELDGTIIIKEWLSRPVDIEDRQVSFTESPEAQSQLVIEKLAEHAPNCRVDEVTVGICDPEVVPFIERSLAAFDVQARLAAGQPVTNTAPLLVLSEISRYLAKNHFSDLASLVRHPDINRWLLAQNSLRDKPDLLSSLDNYQREYLQAKVELPLIGSGQYALTVTNIITELNSLLVEFRGKPRPLRNWSEAIANIFLKLYGAKPLRQGDAEEKILIETFEALSSGLASISEIPEALSFEVNASQAINIIIEHFSRTELAPPTTKEAVELLGWLELLLDDAPNALVTTFNEGFAPESVVSDPFLPDSLRTKLGLLDNDRRYSRDAYVLSALLSSRKFVQLICARRNLAGDALQPSRLLFACDESLMATRLLNFCEPEGTHAFSKRLGSVSISSGFSAPYPKPLAEPRKAMSVTSFKRYLECPYRYYLDHVLKLREIDDRAVELDALGFGSLLHGALDEFGNSKLAASVDRNQISSFLNDWVAQKRDGFFGRHVMPAVRVQLEQLQARLNTFAAWQANRVISGWKIVGIERAFDGDRVRLELGSWSGSGSGSGISMGLIGRIDRIEFNETLGEYAVLDYKSGDNVFNPQQTHRDRDGQWRDLQLPAYYYALRNLGVDKPIRLGYICLPANAADCAEYMAEWTEDELQDAIGRMRDVARNVYAQKFWPPSSEISDVWQDRYQFGVSAGEA